MGSVWVAEHLTLKTNVAVKFMAENFAESPGAAVRFEREAVAAAQIKTPHVVQVFDHGIVGNGVPYIVMELLDGEDLGKRLAAVGRLSPMQTAQIIGQVCKALSKAHGAQIVHRDIKPDNIFLVQSDEGDLFVKVLDFGIAKRHDDAPSSHLTSTGAVVGTPHTMSPEQILSSKHVDFRSDLWSVGVVAYQCITGELPFNGDTFGAIAIAIDRGTYPPPSHFVPGLPPAVDVWFTRALSRSVDGRFSSAREMADELFKAVGVARTGDTGDSSITGQRVVTGPVPAITGAGDPTFAPATLPSSKAAAARVRLAAGGVAAAVILGIGLFVALRDHGPAPVSAESSHAAATVAPIENSVPNVTAPSAAPVVATATVAPPEPLPSASSAAPGKPQVAARPSGKGHPPTEASAHKPPAQKPPAASEEHDRGF
jgi:serine/threonine-protein kinase